jgi:hypothetical protein
MKPKNWKTQCTVLGLDQPTASVCWCNSPKHLSRSAMLGCGHRLAHTRERRGGTFATGATGAHRWWFRSREHEGVFKAAPSKLEEKGAKPGGGSMGRWQKMVAHGGPSTATVLGWSLGPGFGSHSCTESRRVSGRGRLTRKKLGGGAYPGLVVIGSAQAESNVGAQALVADLDQR